jgi:hypothetical protein
MLKGRFVIFGLVVAAMLGLAATAWGYDTPTISGHVWLDANGNGVFDEGPSAALESVRVIFYRDYDCNGVIDGADEMFDYDYTDTAGFYLVVNAYYCYVGYLDPATVPAGLEYSTAPTQSVITGAHDVVDVNFGLKQPDPYNVVCPEEVSFWKKEFKKNKTFSAAELAEIVKAALSMQTVFTTRAQIVDVLNGADEPYEKAERQFATLTLNLAVAEVHDQVGYQMGLEPDDALSLKKLTAAKFVGDAYIQVEAMILSQSNLTLAKKIAKSINQGEGLQLNCE